MNLIENILSWNRVNFATAFILAILVVLSFYGVYTNTFYLTKPDNFVIPLLSIVHFLYLYVIGFKIKEGELPDPKMRNLEYAVYAIMIVYAFKIYESVMILHSTSILEEHYIPETFAPMSISILVLYSLLFILTLYSFWLRKRHVGIYNFENFNDNLNMWQ